MKRDFNNYASYQYGFGSKVFTVTISQGRTELPDNAPSDLAPHGIIAVNWGDAPHKQMSGITIAEDFIERFKERFGNDAQIWIPEYFDGYLSPTHYIAPSEPMSKDTIRHVVNTLGDVGAINQEDAAKSINLLIAKATSGRHAQSTHNR